MLHIPEWGGNPAHWDLPGGRIDEGESFTETLQREVKEELGVNHTDTPKQLTTVLTKMTIPVGDTRLPLIYIIYELQLPSDVVIKLDPESPEDDFRWFKPTEAADVMATKFPTEFCEFVRGLR